MNVVRRSRTKNPHLLQQLLAFIVGFNCFTSQLSFPPETVFHHRHFVARKTYLLLIRCQSDYFVFLEVGGAVDFAESHREVSQLFALHISRLRLKMGFPPVCNQIIP